MRRLLLLAVVAIGLAPATWLRSPVPPEDHRQLLAMPPLNATAGDLGELRFVGAWLLDSPNRHFGSYSALVPLGDGTLLAGSDRGRMLHFSPPGSGGHVLRFDYYAGQDEDTKRMVDLDSLTRDPATGRIWAGYEGTNQIERHDAGFGAVARIKPPAMQTWSVNTGAEAMVRLRDGRFIVLAEDSPRWFVDTVPGLLFPGDPVDGAAPKKFRFVPPEGFKPVDMAQLPDGRVLILLRTVDWGFPPTFRGRLVVADPAKIEPGGEWPSETFAELVSPLPTDNYEGLAIEPAEGGGAVLWLISDDNDVHFQRTLLLKLEWRPNEKARGPGRAPH